MTVIVWHDDERDVTCLVYYGIHRGGISCPPDREVAGQ